MDRITSLLGIITSTITTTITTRKRQWQSQERATTRITSPLGALATSETRRTDLNIDPSSPLPNNGRPTLTQKSTKCTRSTVSINPPWVKSSLKSLKKTKIMKPLPRSSLKSSKLPNRATLKFLSKNSSGWTSSTSWRGAVLPRSEKRSKVKERELQA